MIGIVIPAHNEEALLDDCLRSVIRASQHPALLGEEVRIALVLDDCSDDSGLIGACYPVDIVQVQARSVGVARAAGADLLLAQGARWLACTDADSWVADDWLVAQLRLDADAVCGTVTVQRWSDGYCPSAQHRYNLHYQAADGHRHIHGANLGVSAQAYRQAGGFAPLSCHEDVALVHRLEACGARIAWSHQPQVITSARLDSRAPGGFGDYLKSLLEIDTGIAAS